MKKLSLVLSLVLFSVITLLAQRTISGKVTDSKKEPLIGANLVVEGTSVGVSTDVNGDFTLNLPEGATILVISYTGFDQVRLPIGSESTYSITMQESASLINEVIVTGYGSTSRPNLTGSIAKVGAETISKLPVTGVDQVLQGQAPGVQVTSASGTPGGSVSVRVRGPSSINASNQPLYVVDGIPINTGNYSQLGFGGQQANALADINPTDIESIEVLKDAAAAAIYGSRASNGVVLITTKRGKSQKTSVSLNSYYGVQEAWRTLETLTGPEYITLLNEMIDNRFGAGTTNANNTKNALGILNRDPASFPSTNWQEEVLRTAPISNTDLSFSGGNERTKFYVSSSYFLQDGIIRGSSFDRFSVRLNLDNIVSDKFKIGTSTFFSRSNSTRINNDNNINGVLSAAVLMGSHIPVRNADGTYAKDPNSSVENPMAAALEPTNEVDNGRLLASFFGEYEIAPSLSFRSTFNLDYLSFREFRFLPTTTNSGAGTRGTGNEGYNRDINLVNENYLTFRKSFGKWNIDALLGASFQNSQRESFFAQGENYPGNTIKTLNAASIKRNATSFRTEWGLNSYYSRLNFNFDSKYLFSASLRADGSSRFGDNNRWAVFPSFSAAWRISQEPFLRDNDVISELKLRASWGRRGNSEIGNFASLALIGAGANYNQLAGLFPSQLANPDLTWEEREDIDLSLEVGLFDSRVLLTLEAYQGTTNELLLNRPLVFTSGYDGIDQNIGSMRNRGLDIGLTTTNIKKENFTWSTILNVSLLENEILRLAGTPFAAGFASWVQAGQPIGSFRGYQVEKVFQNQQEIDALNARARELTGRQTAVYQSTLTRPGDLMFRDLNNDGVITGDDQTILGNANPVFQGGFTNNLTFYGFDLSVFVQFVYGNEIFNNTNAFAEGMNGVFGQFATTRNRWAVTNQTFDVRYPRAVWQDPNNNRRTSDRFLEDGSFARLKNVTLGYRLPTSVLRRLGLSNLRLYVTGQNLLTLTDYAGFDPEVSTFGETNLAAGTDFLTFPQARTVIFGLNVGF